MTTTNADSNSRQPLGLASNEGLGPLRAAADAVMAHQWSNNREAMDALTRLIDAAHALAVDVAAERERNRNAGFVEASRMHGQEIERLRSALRLIHGQGGGDFASDIHEARAIARDALGPNVEFSGVPAGHLSNHLAGGTSAGTQG